MYTIKYQKLYEIRIYGWCGIKDIKNVYELIYVNISNHNGDYAIIESFRYNNHRYVFESHCQLFIDNEFTKQVMYPISKKIRMDKIKYLSI